MAFKNMFMFFINLFKTFNDLIIRGVCSCLELGEPYFVTDVSSQSMQAVNLQDYVVVINM